MDIKEKIVGDQYQEFYDFCKTSPKPIALQHEDPSKLTLEDLRQFSIMFEKETGLNISYVVYTCKECNKIHLVMEIDEEK